MQYDSEINEMLIGAITLIASYYNEKIEGEMSIDIPRFIKSDKLILHRYCFCGEEECEICDEPEFFYEPYMLVVSWYKHIGRVFSYSSEELLTPSKIISMINDCIQEIDNLTQRGEK